MYYQQTEECTVRNNPIWRKSMIRHAYRLAAGYLSAAVVLVTAAVLCIAGLH